MNKHTGELFHALMKKGWIDRSENPEIWNYYEDTDVLEEMESLKDAMSFELIRNGDRVYLVPTQDNDLFLKNNVDFRKDISADKTVKRVDLYLMNYLAIYMIYMFYHGSGSEPRCREFATKEQIIEEFSNHCKTAIKSADEDDEQQDYSEGFIQLANLWLAKPEGDDGSNKFGEKYGMLSRILIKFNAEHDDLFYSEAGTIRPTRKMDDLMPYFLRKDRIAEIQEWVKGVSEDATNQ